MINWQAQMPFADDCLFDADSASIVSDHMEVHPCRQARGHPIRRVLQTFSRNAFTDADSTSEVYLHTPCAPSCSLDIPTHLRPAQTMQAAAAAMGSAQTSRLLFLEHSPACYGTPPHAILTGSQQPPEGHRWMLIDLRRVCIPPYPSFFVMPVPPLIDLPWVRCAIRHNFPRLPHFFVAYLDDTLPDRPCVIQATVPLLTVIPMLSGSTEKVALPGPAPSLLDTCSELLHRQGHHALFSAAPYSMTSARTATTTSTTATGMLPLPASGLPFGALPDPITSIQSVSIAVYTASAHTRFVSCTITGTVALEDLLSYVTTQLDEVAEIYNADRFTAVPRVFLGPDGRPTLFLAAINPDSPTTVWVDV